MLKMKKCLLGLLGSLLLLPNLVLAQDDMPPALVKVATASVQALAPVTLVPGTVASRNDARLAAEVDGRLLSVADVGTEVVAGDPVATIEDTVLRLRQQELEAEITRATARLQFLENEEQRFAALAKSNLAAATQLDQTRSERDVARGDLQVARSRLAQNQDQLERTVVRAPFDGMVVERLMTPGERVESGGIVVRMVDQANLEVVARAPLEYYPYVQRGQVLDISSSRANSQAVVRTVVAVGDLNTHQFELRLDLLEQDYPVGQTLRVAVPMSELREVLTVPRDALVLRPGSISVFVIGDDQLARQVNVQTGIGSGDLIEVIGDIADGDTVVVRGNERLRPGQGVSIMGA
jgi:RND family efflux transporter MFP subunit